MTLPLSYSRPLSLLPPALRSFDFAQNLASRLPLRSTPAYRLDLEGCDSTTELLPPCKSAVSDQPPAKTSAAKAASYIDSCRDG